MKENFVGVWLDDEDYRKLVLLSGKTGMDLSKTIRTLIRGGKLIQNPDRDFRELARAVDRIGNNYNQLAYRANRTGMVANEDWLQSHILLEQIRCEIEHWKQQWQ